MKQKLLLLLFAACTFCVSAQENSTNIVESTTTYQEESVVLSDEEIIYPNKDIDFSKQRNFKNDLKSKYSGRDFTYKDNIKKAKKEKVDNVKFDESSLNFFKALTNFMTTVFPYLLALLVIFILVRSFLNTEGGIFKFGKIDKKTAEKLVYEEDENIENNDYKKLLAQAINDKNYRLATRYYYLWVLKRLSQKNLIDYHKDKTNSEYLFELKGEENRKQFSYLSYIYDYVWYGEFAVDEVKFSSIENTYKSFIKKL